MKFPWIADFYLYHPTDGSAWRRGQWSLRSRAAEERARARRCALLAGRVPFTDDPPTLEPPRALSFLWSIGRRHDWFGVELALFEGDRNRSLALSIGFVWASLSIVLENILPASEKHTWPHVTGFKLWSDLLAVHLHSANNACENCAGWSGMSWSIFLWDALLGPARYAERELYTGRFTIENESGEYRVAGRFVEATWTRPRWPFPKILRRAHLDCWRGGWGTERPDQPEPDLSFCCAADTLVEGLETFQNSVVFSRRNAPKWPDAPSAQK